jgi:hypothetical protein
MLITLHQEDMVGFTENLLWGTDRPNQVGIFIPEGMTTSSYVINLPTSLAKSQNLENVKYYISGILEGQKTSFYNAKVAIHEDKKGTVILRVVKTIDDYHLSLDDLYEKYKHEIVSKVRSYAPYDNPEGDVEDYTYEGIFFRSDTPFQPDHQPYGIVVTGDKTLSEVLRAIKNIQNISEIWVSKIENKGTNYKGFKVGCFGQPVSQDKQTAEYDLHLIGDEVIYTDTKTGNVIKEDKI